MILWLFLTQTIADTIKCAHCTGFAENGVIEDGVDCFDGTTAGWVKGEPAVDGIEPACQMLSLNQTNGKVTQFTVQRDWSSTGFTSDSTMITKYRDCNSQSCPGFDDMFPSNFVEHPINECFDCSASGGTNAIPLLDKCINPGPDRQWDNVCSLDEQCLVVYQHHTIHGADEPFLTVIRKCIPKIMKNLDQTTTLNYCRGDMCNTKSVLSGANQFLLSLFSVVLINSL